MLRARENPVVAGQRAGPRLNVGVLGLGESWQQRYRDALLRLPEQFRVGMVGDAVLARAEQEAQRLHCPAAAGPAEMLESGSVDALLLLDSSWYHLWPIELACRTGKPVFCALPLEHDDAHADRLLGLVRASRLPVMVNLAPRWAGPTEQLRQLLVQHLGAVQLLRCTCNQPGQPGGQPLCGGLGTSLIDWCLTLIASRPVGIQAGAAGSAGLVNLLLEFAGGEAASISCRQAPAAGRLLRLEVHASRGQAVVQLPNRVRWTCAEGRFCRRLPRSRPASQLGLLRFHQAVTQRQLLEPNLEDAHRALRCLRAAQRSLAASQKADVPGDPPGPVNPTPAPC